MATIINNTDTTLSPAAQQAVRNAADDLELDLVEVKRTRSYDEGEVYDVYTTGDDVEYLFTVSSPDGIIQ